jgi:lipopolysaccharide export LptBFGC system permease protein LptF
MASPARVIVAAELRVVQSRRDLHYGLRRLRRRLSLPAFLVAAAAVGTLLGFLLTRRGRTSALAGALAIALIRHAVGHFLARAGTSRRIRSS